MISLIGFRSMMNKYKLLYVFACVIAIAFYRIFVSPMNSIILSDPNLSEPKIVTNDDHITINKSLSMWLESWNDFRVLDFSPSGPPLRKLVQAIDARQNPTKCANQKFLVFSLFRSAGFGSLIKSYIIGFHVALMYDRIFLPDPNEKFFWSQGCSTANLDGSLECFFQSLSRSCKAESIIAMTESGVLSSKVVTKRDYLYKRGDQRLSSSAQVVFMRGKNSMVTFKDDSEISSVVENLNSDIAASEYSVLARNGIDERRLYITALTYYFLRLNSGTASFIHSSLQKLLPTELHHDNIIGVPVRASDKCDREMKCEDLSKIIDISHRIAFSFPGINSLIVTSEKESMSKEQTIHNAQNKTGQKVLRLIRNTQDIHPESGTPCDECWKESPAIMLRSSLVTMHLQSFPYVKTNPLVAVF